MTACDPRTAGHRPRTLRRRAGAIVAALGLAVCASMPAWAASNAKSTKFYDDALVRLEKDDVSGAVIQLRNALKEDPDMAAGHLLLGKLQLKYGRPADAEASFDRALRNGAAPVEVALPLAQAHAAQGKLDALLERALPEGLPLQPRLEILLLRGNAQEKKDDHAAAERTFEAARALDPSSVPSGWRWRARCWRRDRWRRRRSWSTRRSGWRPRIHLPWSCALRSRCAGAT